MGFWASWNTAHGYLIEFCLLPNEWALVEQTWKAEPLTGASNEKKKQVKEESKMNNERDIRAQQNIIIIKSDVESKYDFNKILISIDWNDKR